ncbi:MAG: hypothetical protein K2X37_14165, partial [Chitinophagaceae bacterium]|nr:hypothetical protein [Chitinophagaceae bacterium]
MKYYNTFLICIGLLFSSCWWEEPNEASPLDTFTSQINFVVTPDTSEIKVNDTIWFSYNASNTFTAPTGKLKTVSNVNTTMPIRVYRINSGGPWVRSDKLDCEYLFIEGSYSLIPGTNSISYISSVYFNSKYRLKMGFIPQIAGTFFIEINPS